MRLPLPRTSTAPLIHPLSAGAPETVQPAKTRPLAMLNWSASAARFLLVTGSLETFADRYLECALFPVIRWPSDNLLAARAHEGRDCEKSPKSHTCDRHSPIHLSCSSVKLAFSKDFVPADGP